jgi:hypothetical protein
MGFASLYPFYDSTIPPVPHYFSGTVAGLPLSTS